MIFAHAFPIAGLPDRRPPFYREHYGTLGVAIFFVISGFLITQSYFRSRSPWHFTSARVLRVFPALIAVTLLLTMVAGPLLTTLSAGAYFAHPWTWSYPRGAISLFEVTRFTVLPGVFMSNPIVQTNGPLWTLQYQWTFYFVILGLGIAGLLERRALMVGLFIASLVLTQFDVGAGRTLYFTPVDSIFKFFAYFSFGALAYLYRAVIPMSLPLFATTVGILVASSFWGGMTDVPFVFVLGYFILFVGLNPRLHLGNITRGGDYSYGLYLWGWPSQQTVFYLTGAATSVWVQLAISVLLAFVMAAASWHLIEKRALALKPRSGGARIVGTSAGLHQGIAPASSRGTLLAPSAAFLVAMALLIPRVALTPGRPSRRPGLPASAMASGTRWPTSPPTPPTAIGSTMRSPGTMAIGCSPRTARPGSVRSRARPAWRGHASTPPAAWAVAAIQSSSSKCTGSRVNWSIDAPSG